MDPLSLATIALGLAAGAVELINKLWSLWEERKEARRKADPVRHLVAEQDRQEKLQEQQLLQSKQDIEQGKLLPGLSMIRPSAKQLFEIQHSLIKRDTAVGLQLDQAVEQRYKWQDCMGEYRHLSMPQQDLLREREYRRSALRTLPEFKSKDWWYVVVIGPAGSGKSSFIWEQLVLNGYPGTLNKPAPYILDRHKVLLFDSVGDAGSPQVVHGEALAADVLLVFMATQCRSERMHGDAAVLAYRLRNNMRTIFVGSKADQVLQGWREQGRTSTVQQMLADMKGIVLRELQKELGSKRSDTRDPPRSVLERAAGQPFDSDVSSLLQTAARKDESQWVSWAEQQAWLDVVCYISGINAAGPCPIAPKRGLQPGDAEVFLSERRRLMGLMYPPSPAAPAPSSSRQSGVAPRQSLPYTSDTSLKPDQVWKFGGFEELEAAHCWSGRLLGLQSLRQRKTFAGFAELEAALQTAAGMASVAATLDSNPGLTGAPSDTQVKQANAQAQPQKTHSLSAVVSQLKQRTATGIITYEDCQDVAAVLWERAAASKAAADAIVSAGGVPPLVTLLGSVKPEVQRVAAGALCSIAAAGQAEQAAVISAGGVPPLVDLLDSTEQVNLQAVEALRHLAHQSESGKVAILAANGVPPLVRLLQSTSLKVQQHAARTLFSISCGDQTGTAAIAAAEGVSPLVGLLSSTEPETRQYAAYVLWHVAADIKAQKVAIMDAGGVPPLIAMLGSGDTELQAAAMGAICTVSCGGRACTAAIRSSGGVGCLVQQLGASCQALHEKASSTLCNMAAESVHHKAILDAGGVAALVGLLSSSDVKVARNAAEALFNIAAGGNAEKAAIVAAGGFKPLTELLGSADGRTSGLAAQALCNIAAGDDACAAAVVAGDGPNLLNELLPGTYLEPMFAEFVRGQEPALQVLCAMTRNNQKYRDAVVVSLTTRQRMTIGGDCLARLVNLLSSRNSEVQQLAAETLYHIAEGSHANKAAIVAAGGVDKLLSLAPGTETMFELMGEVPQWLADDAGPHEARFYAIKALNCLLPMVPPMVRSVMKSLRGSSPDIAMMLRKNKGFKW